MPLKADLDEEPAPNLTPLIDVLFLLIAFFLIGTKFAEFEQAFEVDLPTASAAESTLTGRPDELVLNVGADGRVTLLGEPVERDRLGERLGEVAEAYPQQVVVIRGDGAVAYREAIAVMDTVKRAGLTNLSLAVAPASRDNAIEPARPPPGPGREPVAEATPPEDTASDGPQPDVNNPEYGPAP